MDQLQLIFDMMGTPAKETWVKFRDLKLLRTGEVKIEKAKRPKLRERYEHKIPTLALSLIEKLLELDPSQRLTAERALESRYFLTEPRAPDRPEDLGPIQLEGGHFHEFQTKKKRREAKAEAEKVRQAALDGGHDAKSAQSIFDATYREIMERVAQEGLDAVPNPKEKEESEQRNEKKDEGDDEEKKSSRSERHTSESGGERDKDRSKRKERRTSKERSEKSGERSKDKERRHRDRSKDKDKSSRHHRSESTDDRRKRKKREKERRRSKDEGRGKAKASPNDDAQDYGGPSESQDGFPDEARGGRARERENHGDRSKKRKGRDHNNDHDEQERFHGRRAAPDDRDWNRSRDSNFHESDFRRNEGGGPPQRYPAHRDRPSREFGPPDDHPYGPAG
ncbi:MAG: hypothetical protein SGARI_002863, partial [Bacillariaceae sp.]